MGLRYPGGFRNTSYNAIKSTPNVFNLLVVAGGGGGGGDLSAGGGGGGARLVFLSLIHI